MVDFRQKLQEYNAWKIRRDAAKCTCKAENGKTCFAFMEKIFGTLGKYCACLCHQEPKP